MAYALPPDGKPDRVDVQEGYIRDGIAQVELTLWWPHYRKPNGDLLDSCEYVFKVKHRDSKEITSERLTITNKKSQCEMYQERLKESFSKLKAVDFGRAEGNPLGHDKKQKIDEEYWVVTFEWDKGIGAEVVELKEGKAASINNIYS